MKDMHNEVAVSSTLLAKNRTSDENGAGVDLAGYEGAEVIANVGLSGDVLAAGLNISLELEESDDDVTYTDVADADMIGETGNGSGQFALIDAASEDETCYKVGYIGSKRYIRAVWNITGTHASGTPGSVTVVKGHARHQPAGSTQTP